MASGIAERAMRNVSLRCAVLVIMAMLLVVLTLRVQHEEARVEPQTSVYAGSLRIAAPWSGSKNASHKATNSNDVSEGTSSNDVSEGKTADTAPCVEEAKVPGERQEPPYERSMPGRLAEAVRRTTEFKRANAFMQLQCPKDQTVGGRPSDHTPPRMGTPCEAWANREWIETLYSFLDSRMVGLEWSSGSGTLWTLRQVHHLYSIEHCNAWLEDIKAHMSKKLPWLTDRWTPINVPRQDGEPCANTEPIDDYAASERIYGNYARHGRQVLQQATEEGRLRSDGFDFVLVDGRHRDACLKESLEPGMVRSDYGLLLLDNAERQYYRVPNDVPAHWLIVSYVNEVDETTLWMACPEEDDANCRRARREIDAAMKTIPGSTGGRYHKHMDRARKAGLV